MTAGAALIDEAVQALRRGGLVAFPTDTVYGLGADPTNDSAVRRLFEAKGRDPAQPVPFLIASPHDLARVAGEVPEAARALMREFWPGGLTIVLPRHPSFRSIAAGETVGVRVPDHPVPRELVRRLGGPVTGTSANVAGHAEPLSAEDVRRELGDAVDVIIDGGPAPGATPSTVIDCTSDPPRIVREGAIGREELSRVLGARLA